MSVERRYNDKELAAILRAAGELQAGETHSEGLTLPEIKRIAEEVGILPAHVEAAASRIDSEGEARKTFSVAPVHRVYDRTFDGELTDESWEEVVAELRAKAVSAGVASTMGSSREWSGGTDFMSLHVSATPKNGKTRFRIAVKQEGALVVGWLLGGTIGLLGSLAAGVALGKSGFPAFAILCAVLTISCLSLAMAAGLVSRWNRKNQQKIQALLQQIQTLMPSPRPSLQPTEPRVSTGLQATLTDHA